MVGTGRQEEKEKKRAEHTRYIRELIAADAA
jgi:hypothetical protein